MKTMTIRFEFPDSYEHDEILDEVTRVSFPIYKELAWKVTDKKEGEENK
jgi:hypothetical protein